MGPLPAFPPVRGIARIAALLAIFPLVEMKLSVHLPPLEENGIFSHYRSYFRPVAHVSIRYRCAIRRQDAGGKGEDPRFFLSKLFFLSMIAKCHLLRANRVVVVVSPVFPLITVSSSCPALYCSGLFRLFLPQNIVVGNG